MAGKGDTPRPKSVSEEVFTKNFESAFGKKDIWWRSKDHQDWVEEAKKMKEKDEKTEKS